jgi:hypothetical protein
MLIIIIIIIIIIILFWPCMKTKHAVMLPVWLAEVTLRAVSTKWKLNEN